MIIYHCHKDCRTESEIEIDLKLGPIPRVGGTIQIEHPNDKIIDYIVCDVEYLFRDGVITPSICVTETSNDRKVVAKQRREVLRRQGWIDIK